MAKQLNKMEVNLEISASTEKAKQAFMDLNKSLSNLQNQNLINPDNGIRQAAQDARELQTHLSNAVNVDTGKLDLNRFSNSLKKSKKELKDYYNSLVKLGPDGEQAFLKLSRSIATAETSTIRVNKKLQEFGVTLKNAARWQISSSILHGFMGTIQGAYGYAKDLDSALNDIRIVTGLSTDEMDKFAVKANQAAKALSTTTTEYAKASLIYFQQGLSDSQVEERTAITMKMANAAGASAETISDQLTAVWNNFYDGSQSLEHFADAMVRLGADTASSSDEIATGLEKFASIGQVIGLGFDEAAAALATVTAQTRQSAEVVGTAFKTIFARIQGLNLGETLDDGTTLNKYSEALAKVGISIKNQYGGIKDMNTLLDEMGAKWDLISKDQQIALAQAVGGVRQYNQIVALMDNYDFYKQNLNAAQNSGGALEEQADIYAQSWEASEKKVKAAAEGVYDSLINEEFFIEFNNNLATLLDGVEGIVNGLGGMEGVLLTVGSLALRYFAKDIPSALKNTKDNVVGLLGLDSKGAKKVQEDNNKLVNSDHFDISDADKKVLGVQVEGTKTLNEMNQKLNANIKKLSAEERKIYEEKIRQVEKDYELLELQAKELEAEESVTKKLQDQIAIEIAKKKLREEEIEEEKELRQLAKEQAESEEKQLKRQAYEQAEKEMKGSKPSKRNEEKYAAYEKKRDARAEEIYQGKINGEREEEIYAQLKKDRSKSKTKQIKDSVNKAKEDNSELKKLKELIIKEEKLVQIRNKYTIYGSKLKEIAEKTEENTKATDELKKSTLEFVNGLEDVDKGSQEYEKLIQTLEKTDASVKEVQEAFENLNKVSEINGIEAAGEYAAGIEELEIKLENMGIDPQELYKLEEAFRSGAIPAEEYEKALERLSKKAEELPEPTTEVSEALAQVGQSIMGFYGMASSIEGLFDVFNDENATVIQKIGASIGGLTSAITAATSAYKALDALSKTDIVNKIKQAMATKKATVAEATGTAVKSGFTAATTAATTAVKAFTAALLSNPFTIIAVALTAIIGIAVSVANAIEKNKEKLKELAKESRETAQASYEEAEANKELADSYLSVLDAYEKGKSSKQELVETTEKVCEAYGIENSELLVAAGRYDELTKKILKYNQEKIKSAQLDAQEAYGKTVPEFIENFGLSDNNNGTSTKVLNAGSWVEDEDRNYLNESLTTLINNKDVSTLSLNDNGFLQVDTDSSIEGQVRAYQDLLKLQQLIKENAREVDDENFLDNNKAYIELTTLIKQAEQSYTDLISTEENWQTLTTQNATIDANLMDRKISNLEEYKKLEKDVIDSLTEDTNSAFYIDNLNDSDETIKEKEEQAKESARKALLSSDNYSKMAREATILEQAAEESPYYKDKIDELQKVYEGLSDEDKTVFTTLNFKLLYDENDYEDQLALLKQRAEKATAETNVEIFSNASEMLKENMSEEDYSNFKENSGIAWGQNGIKSFSEFTRLTFEEQKEYLDKTEKEYQEKANNLATYFETLRSRKETVEEQINNFEKGIENHTIFGNITGDDEYVKAQKSQLEEIILSLNEDDPDYSQGIKTIAEQYGIKEADIINYIEQRKQLAIWQNEFENLYNEEKALIKEKGVENNIEIGKAKQELSEISKIFSNLEEGQIISKEQYEFLEKNGLTNITDNFYKTAEGTYKLKAGIDSLTISWRDYVNISENGVKLFNSEDIANSITNINDLNEALSEGAITQEDYNNRFNVLLDNALAGAKNLNEFRIVLNQFGMDMDKNSEALLMVAQHYSSCDKEARLYGLALNELDNATEENRKTLEKQVEIARDNLYAIMILEDASNEYGLSIEELSIQSRVLQKEYDLNAKQASQLAIENQRMNKGIKTLVDNWEDWKKILKTTNKDTLDWAKTAKECTKAIADLTGASEDLELPIDFFDAERINLVEKAIRGNIEAINLLGIEVAKGQAEMMQFTEDMYLSATVDEENKLKLEDIVDLSEFETWKNNIISGLDDLKLKINGFELGQDVSGSFTDQWIEDFNNMAMATGMTVEEMNSMLNSMGVKTEVVTATKKTYINAPWYRTKTTTDKDGSTLVEPVEQGFKSIPGEIEVAQINVGDEVGDKPKFTYIGNGSVSPSSTSTSKGSKNTGPGKSVKPERYKEINDKLDDVSNAYDKANKAAERLYGPKQISKMKEANRELSKEISLLNIKQKQAKDYLEEDRKALEKASADLGLKIDINDDNLITNYTELMNQADHKLQDAYAKAGDTIDDEQKEVLEALKKKVEDFEAAIAQFDDTREKLEDIENETLNTMYERQDNTFEILNKELEIKVDINDRALKKLDYYADKFSDNYYKLAELYANMVQGDNSRVEVLKDKLADQVQLDDNGQVIGGYVYNLKQLLANGKISNDQYVEGLKNAEEDIRSLLTELNSIDKEMLTAYEEALDSFTDELEDKTDELEHIANVLDHYLTLMDLMGKGQDYDAKQKVLDTQAYTSAGNLAVSQGVLENLRQEKERVRKEYNKFLNSEDANDESLKRYWEKQWDAIVDKTNEAEEQVLSDTEKWLEDMRASIENKMNQAGKALEDALTGGVGFEQLNDEWDKLNTRQEEYYDNVNQIYETNKMMRETQKAIDETNNKVAKERLKGFMEETKSLQEKNKLSKYELEVHQAEYDLLLAEIALEEAQNAKSTVRLSRDSEGNFGYVYTADQDKVADAQQAVDDKRNDLYNLTLEGQQEYTEKYTQASQEMYEELTALQQQYLDGLVSDEEFQIRSDMIKEYYLGSAEFQKEMAELERQWRDGEIVDIDDYNKRRQEIIDGYNAEDIGILNTYLENVNVSNKKANEALQDLDNDYYKNGKLSKEEYEKKKEELTQTYANSTKGILDTFFKNYVSDTDQAGKDADEKWGTNLAAIGSNTSTWSGNMNTYIGAVKEGVNEWKKTTVIANTAAQKALGDTDGAMGNNAAAAGEDKDAIDLLADEINRLTKEILGVDGDGGAKNGADLLTTSIGLLTDSITGENGILSALGKELTKIGEVTTGYGLQKKAIDDLITSREKYLDGDGGLNDEINDLSSTTKRDALSLLDSATQPGIGTDSRGWKEAAKSGEYNNGKIWDEQAINIVEKAMEYATYTDKNGKKLLNYKKAQEFINSYDTGGYTGEWGPEGKLAYLHEKEIVLNKDDTENLLKTVSFIRELVSMIDSQASMSSLFNMSATSGVLTGNTGMEQQITIYADFPDATDHNEIEMAFNTLLNTASQYANRK